MINFEIIKKDRALWDLFTGIKEYTPEKLDKYNRILYSYNINEDISDPKVSKFLLDNGLEVEYPDNKQFAVCLTHDVDEIYPPLSHLIVSSLYCARSLDFEKLQSFLFWKFKGKDNSPYRNFQKILQLEEKYQAKSSFYVLATNYDIHRYRYEIEDLDTELGMIIDHGFEVGLHGGYFAFQDYNKIKTEKERLEKIIKKKIVGYRNHYLKFKLPDTWEILASLNIKYDTTYGYPNANGFRNGMCHPFRPYNVLKDKGIDILEIPLVVGDGTLFNQNHSPHFRWDMVKKLIDTTKRYNGVLTLLWHNDCFTCPFKEEWLKLYQKILEYCYKENALMTSAEEIFKIFAVSYD